MGCAIAVVKAGVYTPEQAERDFGRPMLTRPSVNPHDFEVIACGDGITPCWCCGHVADYLCDYPMGKGKTCDLSLCRAHAVVQEGGRWGLDYCPQHDLMVRDTRTAQQIVTPEGGEGAGDG